MGDLVLVRGGRHRALCLGGRLGSLRVARGVVGGRARPVGRVPFCDRLGEDGPPRLLVVRRPVRRPVRRSGDRRVNIFW